MLLKQKNQGWHLGYFAILKYLQKKNNNKTNDYL